VAIAGTKAEGNWKRTDKVKRVTTGRTPGVFADRTQLMRNEQYLLLVFGQVFDVEEGSGVLLEQCAARVYLPMDAAKNLSKMLIGALKDWGPGNADGG